MNEDMNERIHHLPVDLTFDPGSSCSETVITASSPRSNPQKTRHSPARPTVPLSACETNLLWIKSKGPRRWHGVAVLCESNPALPPPHASLARDLSAPRC